MEIRNGHHGCGIRLAAGSGQYETLTWPLFSVGDTGRKKRRMDGFLLDDHLYPWLS